MKFIGLDVGSVSVKLVVFDEKANRLNSLYERHKGRPLNVALELLRNVTEAGHHEINELSPYSTTASFHHFSLYGFFHLQ